MSINNTSLSSFDNMRDVYDFDYDDAKRNYFQKDL